jgi:hypothetical protein
MQHVNAAGLPVSEHPVSEITQAARPDQANHGHTRVEKKQLRSQLIFAGQIMQKPHQKAAWKVKQLCKYKRVKIKIKIS